MPAVAPGAIEADSDLSKPPMPKDDGEKRILAALEQARGGERYANVSTADGRLLRQLAESIGARRIVELGTSTGESGLWFSTGVAQDRRQALHPRHRPRPDRRRPRELQEGPVSRISSSSPKATPTRRRRGTRTRSTSCSSTPRRKVTTPTSRNSCPTSAPAG